MLQLVATILVASGLLSAAAIGSFSWSVVAAKGLLMGAFALAAVGVMAAGLASGQGGIVQWAFLFACASGSCTAIAVRQLFDRPTRWVPRFVIYAGYGA